MYITFPVEKMSANWCREKTRTISGNIILYTNLPRDVREVSSFEAKKGTVEHLTSWTVDGLCDQFKIISVKSKTVFKTKN